MFTIFFQSKFGRDTRYAPIVALAVSLHGPFWPRVLTQRSMLWGSLLASAPTYFAV